LALKHPLGFARKLAGCSRARFDWMENSYMELLYMNPVCRLGIGLSFEAWRRYRQDLNLPSEEAPKAMLETMEVITKGY